MTLHCEKVSQDYTEIEGDVDSIALPGTAAEVRAQDKSKDPDKLLNIQAAVRQSNLRLDAVRRYPKTGEHS